MKREAYKSLRTISHDDPLGPGGSLCAGCGGQLTLQALSQGAGRKRDFRQCRELLDLARHLSVYPAAARRGFIRRWPAPPRARRACATPSTFSKPKASWRRKQDRKVVVLTGDGAAQDIGLQSTMAAIYRGLDFYYLCYDNESYGNTGFQTSASTPYGSRTSTAPITPSSLHGSLHERRDLFEIWRVQKPPYLATISAAYPLDLSEKVYRASKLKGRNFSSHMSPCPPGWEVDPEWSVEVARLGGRNRHLAVSKKRSTAKFHTRSNAAASSNRWKNYLKRQGRFRHLFEPNRDEETIAHIQTTVDDYWRNVAAKESTAPSESRRADHVSALFRRKTMQNIFDLRMISGPVKIVHIYDPKVRPQSRRRHRQRRSRALHRWHSHGARCERRRGLSPGARHDDEKLRGQSCPTAAASR